MKKLQFISAFLVMAVMAFFYGCGEDDPVTVAGGTPPTLDMRVGSVYISNIDSLPVAGGVIHTRLLAYDTIKAKGTFFGQADAYQVNSALKDSTIPFPLGSSSFYVRYEGGKYYQYGMLALISPAIPPSWDLVADFNLALGSQFTIATGVAIPNITGATANITATLSETSFNASGFGSVNCFKSEIAADIIIATISVGKVYVD